MARIVILPTVAQAPFPAAGHICSITQSTGQATFATSTTTIDINGALNFNMHWTSWTKKELLTVPLPLLAFM
jgi:hypothetical protein